MYFTATMQSAADDSARWAAIYLLTHSGTAPSCGQVLSHFNTRYLGPAVSCASTPWAEGLYYSASATESACSGSGAGSALFHQVTVRAAYNLNAVIGAIPIALKGSACFAKS
jgi:hypothetical protein